MRNAIAFVSGSMRPAILLASLLIANVAAAQSAHPILTGPNAYTNARDDVPGTRRRFDPDDLPAPLASRPVSNPATTVRRPADVMPRAPAGFSVELAAEGLRGPRAIRVAPNGDVFVAETRVGRVLVLRPDAEGHLGAPQIFLEGFPEVYGMAFPPGDQPSAFYFSTETEVYRVPYQAGDTAARARPEPVVRGLPRGGHSTRDLAFSADGKTLFVAVGSESNVAEDMPRKSRAAVEAFEKGKPPGAAWGEEERRADVLAMDPDSGHARIFATGLRNCAGLTIRPGSDDLWCVVNERDLLGDDLPPDYATRVRENGFYGWPWFYIGAHEDPRLRGQRPDLSGKAIVPDVLIQPHSAPLQIAFDEGAQFPADYRGGAFVALHGSWNRARPTGYKVIRLLFRDGKPTGEYEDFLTGFVTPDGKAWGRPVGVAVGKDGSLYVSEDASGTLWRVRAK